MTSCENCGNSIYEGQLHCNSCRTKWEACIVSGYPLLRSAAVSCQTCNKGAIREHWNEYVATNMVCPWCKSMSSAV
jgi:intraflagellar transport protein 172